MNNEVIKGLIRNVTERSRKAVRSVRQFRADRKSRVRNAHLLASYMQTIGRPAYTFMPIREKLDTGDREPAYANFGYAKPNRERNVAVPRKTKAAPALTPFQQYLKDRE